MWEKDLKEIDDRYNELLSTEKNKLIEKFFRIWITKIIFSWYDWLSFIYKNFLDEDWKFSLEKYLKSLDFIIKTQIFSDWMYYRYNSLRNLSKNELTKIINHSPNNFTDDTIFWEDLMDYFSNSNWYYSLNYDLSSDEFNEVKRWLNKYLISVYNPDISTTIESILKVVYDIIETK